MPAQCTLPTKPKTNAVQTSIGLTSRGQRLNHDRLVGVVLLSRNRPFHAHLPQAVTELTDVEMLLTFRIEDQWEDLIQTRVRRPVEMDLAGAGMRVLRRQLN